MVSRKYVGDFEIREEYDPRRGRKKEVTVYVGPWFRFVYADRIRQIKRRFLLLSLLCQCCFWAMMLINARCTHVWYSMMPVVLLMLPLAYLWAADWRLLTAGERVIREHCDKIMDRFLYVLIGNCVLSGLALAGHIAFSIIWGDEFRDLLFYPLDLLLLLTSVYMLKNRHQLDMKAEEEA